MHMICEVPEILMDLNLYISPTFNEQRLLIRLIGCFVTGIYPTLSYIRKEYHFKSLCLSVCLSVYVFICSKIRYIWTFFAHNTDKPIRWLINTKKIWEPEEA